MLLATRQFRLHIPATLLLVSLILTAGSFFDLPSASLLVMDSAIPQLSTLYPVVIIFTHELISESALTALLSHAAFFYLISSIIFLIPVFILY